MDTSNEYINMCEKASEIQKTWKPEEWDLVSTACAESTEKDLWVRMIYDLDDFNNEGESYIKDFPCKTWLPRQDQLQEMVGDSFILLSGVFVSFYTFFIDHIKDNSQSFEQIWLEFVMKEKFNKVWDGNEWILKG